MLAAITKLEMIAPALRYNWLPVTINRREDMQNDLREKEAQILDFPNQF